MIIFYLFIYLCWSLSKLFQRWSFEPLFQAVDGWIGWRTGDRWKCDSLDDFWINCSAGEEEPAAALEQTNKQTNKALSERDGHVCRCPSSGQVLPTQWALFQCGDVIRQGLHPCHWVMSSPTLPLVSAESYHPFHHSCHHILLLYNPMHPSLWALYASSPKDKTGGCLVCIFPFNSWC